jgi:RNA polymerase sigma-70 factor (ECF subfamily)
VERFAVSSAFPATFLARTPRACRYRGVEVVSMSGRWVEAEFEAIFREHYGRIVRVIRRVLQRDSEAEEVCAEVFLRLYRTGPGVAATGLVGAWLYRTATRASIDVLRANRRRGLEVEDDGAMQNEDPTEGPLTLLLRQERIAEVRDVLAKLKVDKAQLLLLHHSGLTYQEIAQAMQMNVHSVGTKLARAEAEFSALCERHRRRNRKTQQLQTAKEGQ